MKIKFVIVLFFIGIIKCFSQDEINEFIHLHNYRNPGIKNITETSFSQWKTVYLYDTTGFLLQHLDFYKNEPRGDYRYEYLTTDTVLLRKEKEYLNINNNKEHYTVHKYYYNSGGLCEKLEIYFSDLLLSPSILIDNIIYKDSLLRSYERGSFPRTRENPSDKRMYIYNEKKQITQILYCIDVSSVVSQYSPDFASKDTTFYSFIYNKEGKLTDYITESGDKKSVFTGVICWSNSMLYKTHIRYTDFDKQGNWRKSYFMTEKGKIFRSKRKIEYY
jgi:hypothetical protein